MHNVADVRMHRDSDGCVSEQSTPCARSYCKHMPTNTHMHVYITCMYLYITHNDVIQVYKCTCIRTRMHIVYEYRYTTPHVQMYAHARYTSVHSVVRVSIHSYSHTCVSRLYSSIECCIYTRRYAKLFTDICRCSRLS